MSRLVGPKAVYQRFLLALSCMVSLEIGAISLSLDNAELIELVKWASEVTQKNIIIHPDVEGQVTVTSGGDLTNEEAYQVFLAVLQVHGFTVVDEGPVLRVLPGAHAKSSGLPVLEGRRTDLTADMVVQIVRIQNVASNRLLSLLQPMVSSHGYIAAYPETNMLLLADRATNVEKLLAIIQRMDQTGLVEIELLEVRYASAKDIASTLGDLMSGSAETPSPLKFSVDERSNSLLMTGDPITRQQVRALVSRLDQPLAGSGNTQVIHVEYADAAGLIPVLQGVAKSLQKYSKDQSLEDEITLEAVSELNTIVVSAPPSVISTLRGVIAELDVPRAQVLVEAMIVEVSQELGNKLGVEWASNAASGEYDTVGGFSFFPSGLSPLELSENGFSLGSGLSVGHLRGGSLRAVVNALATDSDANILSTPTVLALDNEEASILVGSNVPFLTGSESQDNGNPFTTVQREDIGIFLRVRPRVNNDNSVTLEIEQTVEDISTTAVVASDIITNKREIKTRVLIENGRTLVLGGLIRDEASEVERGVPLLSRIPLLGRALKSTDTAIVKRNLMVFIRPVIMNTQADLEKATSIRYEQLQRDQKQFRKHGDMFWILGESPNVLPDLDSRAE